MKVKLFSRGYVQNLDISGFRASDGVCCLDSSFQGAIWFLVALTKNTKNMLIYELLVKGRLRYVIVVRDNLCGVICF